MTTAAAVLVCVLDLLGRSADRLPPIRILETRPPGVSANADAFVSSREDVIYLIASAPAFRTARSSAQQCGARDALRLVASIIVHEEWHLRHGDDERGAYHAQLTELQRLGVGPDRWAYYSVKRSMQAVLGASPRRPPASPLARAAARGSTVPSGRVK
jgi:hypothetical protein